MAVDFFANLPFRYVLQGRVAAKVKANPPPRCGKLLSRAAFGRDAHLDFGPRRKRYADDADLSPFFNRRRGFVCLHGVDRFA